MLQVLEARIDHTRVVSILRKADHLPLVKDYLVAVQKANLAAVNDAVNELLIEEEDFKVKSTVTLLSPAKYSLVHICTMHSCVLADAAAGRCQNTGVVCCRVCQSV